MKFNRLSASILVSSAFALVSVALAHLSSSVILPLDHSAIKYTSTPANDAAAQLNEQISGGQVKLKFTSSHGYLESVLKALDVPVSSQVLVFTKTSFQAPRIAPRTPRALYFNDKVSVGWVRGGDVLEIAAVDPKQGVVFYTLDQEPASRPKLLRQDSCLQCHASGGTLGVPGLMLRSVNPDQNGMPLLQAGSAVVTHETPIEKRWGGWYVTGKHGELKHKGNAIAPNRNLPEELESEGTQNLTDLARKFDTGAYLSGHSDIVALMVMEHQVQMTNLMTRVGFEARLALHDQAVLNPELGTGDSASLSASSARRINGAVEELIDYMLFAKEAKLGTRVAGTTRFADEFQARGRRDAQGRSLRDLDLERRLFRYPCSFMIYSDAFDAMPLQVRKRIFERMDEILKGADTSPRFQHLTEADRTAISQILGATKPRKLT